MTKIDGNGTRAGRPMAHGAACVVGSAMPQRATVKAKRVTGRGHRTVQAVFQCELFVVALWHIATTCHGFGVVLREIVVPRLARERRNDWARCYAVAEDDILVQCGLLHAPIKGAAWSSCFRDYARDFAYVAMRLTANQRDYVAVRPKT